MTSHIKDIWIENYKNSAEVNIQKTKPVPITALSENYFEIFEISVKNFQKWHPGRKIVVYDLGLSAENANFLKENGHIFVYKKFIFENNSKYPEHVKNLDNFAWRNIIWAEALTEFGAIIWFDASTKFTRNTDSLVENMQEQGNCIQTFVNELEPKISISHGIHPLTYNYLASNITTHSSPENMMKSLKGTIIFNSKNCKNNIMRWSLLCALNEECWSPTGLIKNCPIGTNIYQPHICHKFDTAIVNMLLVNTFGKSDEEQKRYFVGPYNVYANSLIDESEDDDMGEEGAGKSKADALIGQSSSKDINYAYIYKVITKHLFNFHVLLFTFIAGNLILFKNKLA